MVSYLTRVLAISDVDGFLMPSMMMVATRRCQNLFYFFSW